MCADVDLAGQRFDQRLPLAPQRHFLLRCVCGPVFLSRPVGRVLVTRKRRCIIVTRRRRHFATLRCRCALRRHLHRNTVLQLFLERFYTPAERVIAVSPQTAQPHRAQLSLNAAVGCRAHMVERIADNAAPRDERGRRQTVTQRLQRLYAVRRRNKRGNVGLAGLDQQCIADQAKHLIIHGRQITACVVIFVQQADCRRQITGFQVLG